MLWCCYAVCCVVLNTHTDVPLLLFPSFFLFFLRYVTCGDDKTVRLWDLRRRDMITSYALPAKAKAAAIAPGGEYIAVTLDNGGVVVLDGQLKKVVKAFKHTKKYSQVGADNENNPLWRMEGWRAVSILLLPFIPVYTPYIHLTYLCTHPIYTPSKRPIHTPGVPLLPRW